MTPHNEAEIGDFAKTVIMPGDPLRAKYIAENFLEDAKLVNSVRNMLAYTGLYKGKRISVMAHGMGMPSVGIYSYELYKFYDVENIIRIGSCGGYIKELDLFDVVLADDVYTEGNYALTFNNEDCHLCSSNKELNSIIKQVADISDIKVTEGNTVCTDAVDFYMTNPKKFFNRIPKNINPIAAEMEAFALFYNAKLLNKKAACLMTVVDSQFINKQATPEEREQGLTKMIKIALEAGIFFGNKDQDEPSSLIVIAVKTQAKLEKAIKDVEAKGIKVVPFYEPSWDYGLTAFGTEPLTQDVRVLLKRYQLWK